MKTQSHNFFSTLKPHAIAAQVSLGLLTVFHATLLILWARGTLDHRLFSLQRIGFATQSIAVTTQVFSVLSLALLCFAIQAISSDQIVRQGASTLVPRANEVPTSVFHITEQTLAGKYPLDQACHVCTVDLVLIGSELHDGLVAWSGLGAAAMAFLHQTRSPIRITLSLVLVIVLYVAVAVLHISVPSVLSIGTVSVVGNVPPISAIRMPGNITAIGYNRTDLTSTPELRTVITAMAYLWEQRNSTRLPAGWDGTWVVIRTRLCTTPDLSVQCILRHTRQDITKCCHSQGSSCCRLEY